MGKTVRCPECGEVYRSLERIEDLRDNDGVCLVCNAPIEGTDWDKVLASYEDEDLDDVDDLEEVDELDEVVADEGVEEEPEEEYESWSDDDEDDDFESDGDEDEDFDVDADDDR